MRCCGCNMTYEKFNIITLFKISLVLDFGQYTENPKSFLSGLSKVQLVSSHLFVNRKLEQTEQIFKFTSSKFACLLATCSLPPVTIQWLEATLRYIFKHKRYHCSCTTTPHPCMTPYPYRWIPLMHGFLEMYIGQWSY